MGRTLEFEDGHLGGDIVFPFPDYKNGKEFSGVRDSVPSGAHLVESNMIFIKDSRKFIKYDQISAYRWRLSNNNICIEMKIINPRVISKSEGLKELI